MVLIIGHKTRRSRWRSILAGSTPGFVLFGMIALVLGLSACGGGVADRPSERVQLVVTTSIWGDIVKQVVGDAADVQTVIGVGVDPHDFAPSARHVQLIREADLVVSNGLGLEEGLEDALDAAAADGTRLIEVAPELDPLPLAGSGSALDPHVWLDPQRVSEAAGLIVDALTVIEPTVDWSGQASSYMAELAQLDSEIERLTAALPDEQRNIVTNHDAFGYFADRYGFEIVGVVIPGGSTMSEPSASDLAEVVEAIRATGVRSIFVENTSPTLLAEAIASEVGDVSLYELSTGALGEPGSEADSYLGLMTNNAETMVEALR